MKKYLTAGSLAFAVAAAGCAGVATDEQPSIAHAHIGRALTASPDTPGNEGLYVVAENEARRVLELASSVNGSSSLTEIKSTMREIMEIIDPSDPRASSNEHYGLRRAFTGAMEHLELSANSDDASANVRASMPRIEQEGRGISERLDLIYALAGDIQRTGSASEAAALAGQVRGVAREVVFGVELDGVDPIGSRADEYGLVQLGSSIAAMTAREDPPYVPPSTRWLLGLERQPDGEWSFDVGSAAVGAGAGGGIGGGGGGGGGAY